ncbi:MAG: hypothetical protein MJZ64_00795 [Paludibacteraceae bacterium]|nr:hypothetical protein [Paludibacteraceae bacterium]
MKLEEITSKIYAEGVEKGNQEAQAIIAKAKEEAQAIIDKATAEAQAQLQKAEQKAQEMDAHTRSELKMFTEQSLNALKTQVTDLVNGKVVEDNIKAATADPKFMQGIIAKMAESMAKDGAVTIDAKDADALKTYFATNAKGLLDKGVTINEVKGLKTDFQLKPEKGGYKMSFGEAEFIAYFKEFLRPQLIELLF